MTGYDVYCNLIAVCIYRYVIAFGLSGKYDMDGHYSRFVA